MDGDIVATLQAQLDGLREARASGLRRVRFDTEEIEYRNDADLAAAIADLERRIANCGGRRLHTVKLFSSKGF